MSPTPSCDSRVVVVGAGHGGVQVADSLRAGGHTGPVTVLDGEDAAGYQRPPLSKEHLTDEAPSVVPLPGARRFAEQDVELRTGVPVTGIDRDERVVTLADGDSVPYDAAVLATGAANRRPDVPGADLAGIHELRTLEDAETLRGALAGAGSVLVVGAGFIGLEFAAAARARGIPVTVLEAAELPLVRALSPPTASHVAAVHRAAGTDLHCGEPVARFLGSGGRVRGAVGASGTEYRADLVLVGVGVRPRVELAERAGLVVDDGIVVDAHLRTSDPTIHAVGDCANHPNVHTGSRQRLESVQNALDQGRHVASVILGGDERYADLPWFWSRQGTLTLQIAGIRRGGDDAVVLGDPAAGRFSVCSFRGERLVAVESANRPADHLAARRLLTAGCLPTRADLADPDFTLKAFAKAAVG